MFNTSNTTTIDRGGAIHSQARSIYSFGGGMTSFQGKRVSLLAADAPSFSAGCSGISWHFGGFAFISMDEIRQLVEAIAQASLGVVVDLAMQTLCPQCYAVMSKLRDIANAMRNANMNSCQIAKNLGAQLFSAMGLNPADKVQQECGYYTAGEGKSDSSLMSQITSGLCSAGDGVATTFNTKGQNLLDWYAGKPGAKAPDREDMMLFGNITYDGLSALGYEDGFTKDLLMSIFGMVVRPPTLEKDCTQVYRNVLATAEKPAASTPTEGQEKSDAAQETLLAPSGVVQGNDTSAGTAKCTDDPACDLESGSPAQGAVQVTNGANEATVADVATKDANTSGTTNTKKGSLVCPFGPLITDVKMLGSLLVCGFNPWQDYRTFQNNFASLGLVQADDTLTQICGTMSDTPAAVTAVNKTTDYKMYKCSGVSNKSMGCMRPEMVRLQDALKESDSSQKYSGMAFLIMDALFRGVVAIQSNNKLPDDTLAILNNAGYPLYRLLNIAAVYPGMAVELLQAYSIIIAIHYSVDTLTKLTAPGGAATQVQLVPKGTINSESMLQLRHEILDMTRSAGTFKDQAIARLSEKQTLVNRIVQINRVLQAEVVSQGIAGNADLATSLKKQQTPKVTP